MEYDIRSVSAEERKLNLQTERRYYDIAEDEDWLEKQLYLLWSQLASSAEPGEILKKAAKLLKEREKDEH